MKTTLYWRWYDFKRPRADILGAGKLYVTFTKRASPAERWARDDYVDKDYIEYCCARMTFGSWGL